MIMNSKLDQLKIYQSKVETGAVMEGGNITDS